MPSSVPHRTNTIGCQLVLLDVVVTSCPIEDFSTTSSSATQPLHLPGEHMSDGVSRRITMNSYLPSKIPVS